MQKTNARISGYDYVKTDDGKMLAVDARTGEALPTVSLLLPVGSIAYTPRQQENYKARKEAEQRKVMLRDAKNELGYFFFTEAKDRRNKISSQSLARLMFLATYLRYGSNYLYRTERVVLQKADLPKLMGLPLKTFYRFWDEVVGSYLFEDSNGQVYISNEFLRGKLTSQFWTENENRHYQQIYIKALRKLYFETPTTKHRYLGYAFLMLPYINFEYNILCWNPEETELEKLEIITLDELCDAIGYDRSQRARLLDAYRKLTFDWRGKQQHLCAFITDDLRIGNMRIMVNPHIIYRGSNWHKVEVLGAFF